MRNPIMIHHSHTRAIIREIGERLRTRCKQDRELPASLKLQIDRLSEPDGRSHPDLEKPTTH
jgi:hypothetical protein